jgi:hypothetical protein
MEKDGTLQPLLEKRSKELKQIITGDPNYKGLLTYDQLAKLQTWLLKRFDYQSDDYVFNKDDLWDTTAWKEALLAKDIQWHGHPKGMFGSDCDSFGYAVLGILYYVFGYSKSHLERVACATETNEGHFVAWIQSKEGVVYQMENRIRKPRSVKYMRDFGYEYWHYSKMTNVSQWFDARKRASEIIYNTPSNLKSDRAEFELKKVFKIHKSKFLIKDWTQVFGGLIITVKSMLILNANEIANTLEAHKQDLSMFIDGKYIGITVMILGFVGLYLRTVTDKDLNLKKSINE